MHEQTDGGLLHLNFLECSGIGKTGIDLGAFARQQLDDGLRRWQQLDARLLNGLAKNFFGDGRLGSRPGSGFARHGEFPPRLGLWKLYYMGCS